MYNNNNNNYNYNLNAKDYVPKGNQNYQQNNKFQNVIKKIKISKIN
jgi:hypothetical protein